MIGADYPPAPRPIRERCAGSLQLTLAAAGHDAPCIACGQSVAVVPIDGVPHLVEHRARQSEALPMELFA